MNDESGNADIAKARKLDASICLRGAVRKNKSPGAFDRGGGRVLLIAQNFASRKCSAILGG